MKRVYGYVRVSTVKQGQQGVSLQEQRDAIEKYAARNNLAIVSWFEEQETAAKYGRRVFSQMLKLLKARKADGVVIHKIDRGSRNLKDWSDLGALVDQGVELHFAHESIDLQTRGGRLSADIQAVIAADYVRNLRDEIKKGFYGRLKQGFYPLPAPLGYQDKGGGKIKQLDPIKAPLVKRAFELYASGRYNLKELVEEMNQLNLRNRNGSKLTKSRLAEILKNPFYMGLLHVKSTNETFIGNHEPIISKKLFDRVEAVRSGKFNSRSNKHDFIYRRSFKCQQCGYSLIGEMQKGHIYYRCHSKACPVTTVREEDIEKAIIEIVSPIQLSEDELTSLYRKVEILKAHWDDEKKVISNTIELHLNQISSRLARLTDAYIDRLIEKEDFDERKSNLLMERRDLEEKLGQIRSGNDQIPDRMTEFLELAKSVCLTYKMAIPEEKRSLLHLITSNRTVGEKNVVIELKSPFKELAERGKLPNGGPYRDEPRTFWAETYDTVSEYKKFSAPIDTDRTFETLYQFFVAKGQSQ